MSRDLFKLTKENLIARAKPEEERLTWRPGGPGDHTRLVLFMPKRTSVRLDCLDPADEHTFARPLCTNICSFRCLGRVDCSLTLVR